MNVSKQSRFHKSRLRAWAGHLCSLARVRASNKGGLLVEPVFLVISGVFWVRFDTASTSRHKKFRARVYFDSRKKYDLDPCLKS